MPAELLYGPWLLCGKGKEAGNVPRNGITSQLFRGPEATRPPRVKRGQIEHLQRSMESAEDLGPGSRYEIWLCCLQAWLCPVATRLPTHIGLVFGMAAQPLPFFMEVPQFQCFCSSLTSPVGPMALFLRSSSAFTLILKLPRFLQRTDLLHLPCVSLYGSSANMAYQDRNSWSDLLA